MIECFNPMHFNQWTLTLHLIGYFYLLYLDGMLSL